MNAKILSFEELNEEAQEELGNGVDPEESVQAVKEDEE